MAPLETAAVIFSYFIQLVSLPIVISLWYNGPHSATTSELGQPQNKDSAEPKLYFYSLVVSNTRPPRI